MKMVDEKHGFDFTELEQALPPIIFRNWPRWRDVLPIGPRTVANLDSLGQGPPEKLIICHVTGYPRTSFLKWLGERTRRT
jgi:hypothetical protein